MPVTLELTRPKSVATNTQNTDLTVGTVVEVDTSVEESQYIPVRIGSIDPPPFTVSGCATTISSTSVTTTAGGFARVRAGDVITGTGIPASTTVTAKGSDNNSLTLSQAATATGTSLTLTFDPPAFTPTIYAIRIRYSKSGSAFGVALDFMTYDGTLGSTTATAANATKTTTLLASDGQPISIDIDQFLTNARLDRTA
jgi:energy-converting hydrogenase Eha subunit E